MKPDIPEVLTIFILGAMAVCAIFKLPPNSAEKIALSIGSGLAGYLSKTAYDAMKSIIYPPVNPPNKPEVK